MKNRNHTGANVPVPSVARRILPVPLTRQIEQWEKRDLRLALAIMNKVIDAETRVKFWEHYRQALPLNPPPAGVIVEGYEADVPPALS